MSNNHIDPDLAVEVFILESVAGDGLDGPSVNGHTHRRDLGGHGPLA